ncbi:ankyrin repeat domain-containing protein [Paraburkholderia sp. Ac-20342]|uniref:ankyrin repeat domain-containing protein n=1 Tax=unclassified Paraburkholderia TaxID=2615204 RepID=UPI00141F8AEF|nr:MULTISPECIES: ankyrin repeat domain-containing protein [unclassified Paraburkholderia]MBN3851228.1 ankyrin repeat domain-containing protein [Paraburkholderia sp. Ac-20342]NIF81616.1 ankyrin repeat domain-containing protein [Paraburkholderia sp. Cy-641]
MSILFTAMKSRETSASSSQFPSTPSASNEACARESLTGTSSQARPQASGALSRLMQMRRQRGSASEAPPPKAHSAAPADLRLHAAVRRADATAIRELVDSGLKPVHLNDNRQTPLDVLDSMALDVASSQLIRSALLHSQNESAPLGYVKPEAFHGSPWGFEILLSGELRGGVNDTKGGTQSLEGKVFFSDRTPTSPSEPTTRTDLRKNARIYSNGSGWKATTASSRGFQYRMVQAMLEGIKQKAPLNMQGAPETIEAQTADDIWPQIVGHLGQVFHKTGSFEGPEFEHATLNKMFEAIQLPSSLTLKVAQTPSHVVQGRELYELYGRAATQLKQQFENGKTPFLAVINEGRMVPVVFGFEKVSGLQSHTIEYMPPKGPKSYSYQSANHPLTGSDAGGKLKEIEVRDLEDLATLSLACLARGVAIPEDATIRLKKRALRAPKAHYLTSTQRAQFEAAIIGALSHKTGNSPKEMRSVIENASIEQLQVFNAYLRSLPLTKFSVA